MTLRLWTAAGLLSGVLTGLVLLVLVVVFGPEPGIARETAPPSPGPTTAATAAGTPASGSPTPGLTPGAGASGTHAPTAAPGALGVGGPAPVLVVPQVGGGTIDVAALRGRPVWLVFFTTSCSACVQELSLMNGYLSRYSPSGLVALGIDVGDDEGAVTNVARRAGATFPFGLDLDASAQREWDAQSLPASFWVDKDGVIRDAAAGILGAERMAAGLRQILPGVDVQP